MTPSQTPKPMILLAVLLLAVSLTAVMLATLSGKQIVQAAGVAGGTNVSGPIITHTTWTVAGSPYILLDEVTVNPGITLTVVPGVLVIGEIDGRLTVLGNIEAVGTVTNPITFTAMITSSGWGGIVFQGEHGHLKQATIEYGNYNLWLKDTPLDARFLLEDSRVSSISSDPIRVELGVLYVLEMVNVSFSEENYDSIFVNVGSNPPRDVTLTSQPGLDEYLFFNEFGQIVFFQIEPTVTLTLSPGVHLYLLALMQISGNLEATGTAAEPINISGIRIEFWEGGGYINHTTFYSMSVIHYGQNLFPELPARHENVGASPGLVIENSVFEGLESTFRPIYSTASVLHQLHLSNVTFDGFVNRVSLLSFPGETGALVENVTLTPQPGLEAYEYASDFIVPSGITLTMAPGTALMGNVNAGLVISGHLAAEGTAQNPITFTTAVTDNWSGINLTGGSVNFDFVTLSQAGGGSQSALAIDGDASLQNTAVYSNSGNGIDVRSGSVTAVCATFTQNQSDGIHIFDNDASVTIFNSSISDNGGAGLNNENSMLVDARYNWWGDASGPGGIGPGSGDEISGTVSYEPWLIEPPTTCFTSLPTAVFHTNHVTVTEGAATAVLTITLAPPPGITATVHVSTTANTAQPFQDYEPLSTTLTFPPGQTAQTVTVTILDDGQVEMTESLTVTLSAVANVVLGSPATAIFTIMDDDTEPVMPVLSFAADTITVTEGMATAVLTLTLNIAPEITVTVNYETVADTAVAHSDYQPVSGTLTFAPGSTAKVVTVPLLDDDLVESNETFNFVLSSPMNLIVAGDTVVIVIQDDDIEMTETAVIYLPFITTSP